MQLGVRAWSWFRVTYFYKYLIRPSFGLWHHRSGSEHPHPPHHRHGDSNCDKTILPQAFLLHYCRESVFSFYLDRESSSHNDPWCCFFTETSPQLRWYLLNFIWWIMRSDLVTHTEMKQLDAADPAHTWWTWSSINMEELQLLSSGSHFYLQALYRETSKAKNDSK